MSLVMRKPVFNAYAKTKVKISCTQLIMQSLYFRYIDSTIPLLPKSEISSISPSSVVVHPAVCVRFGCEHKDRFSCDVANVSAYSCALVL